MPNIIVNRRVLLRDNVLATYPIGDIFVDKFNPQIGTYYTSGSAVRTVTAGNMSISGGNGFFNNLVILDNIIWNGNNWYTEHEYIINGTAQGQYSACFGFVSTNTIQPQNLYYGLYYAPIANKFNLDIFKSNPSLGQIISSGTSGQRLSVVSGERVKLRADFTESTIVVTATNMTTPDSVSVTYTWPYNVGATNIKPNLGQLTISAPTTAIDLKSFKFGSQYSVGVDRLFIGDSITSGYYGGSESNRFQNQYAIATGKKIATFAGPGDGTKETNKTAVLNYIKLFKPKKAHILLGTNDIANGLSQATIQANLSAIISSLVSIGTIVFVGTILPRNGQNNTVLNTYIRGLSGVTVVEYYNNMESSPGSGNINSAYSSDNIHPNAVGETYMKNLLIASGF